MQLMKQTKKQNQDSKIVATVGGSFDTLNEVETGLGTSRQLAHAFFKIVENQSFNAEIVMADESVIGNVFEI